MRGSILVLVALVGVVFGVGEAFHEKKTAQEVTEVEHAWFCTVDGFHFAHAAAIKLRNSVDTGVLLCAMANQETHNTF